MELTRRDLDIFTLLQRYRYLPSNFLGAFFGGYTQGFRLRLQKLTEAGYLYRPRQQQQAINARYKFRVYELGNAGRECLQAHGLRRAHHVGYGRHFHHEVMVCLIGASFELGARDAEFSFLSWADVLDHPQTPKATAEAPEPFKIPVSIAGRTIKLVPDGRPFAIRSSNGTLCFPGFEADRCMEPLEPLNTGDRASIEQKFRLYLEVARTGIHVSHFGFPNMIVPFVTTSPKRMQNMMKLLAKITDGKGCSCIIFHTMPDLAFCETSQRPPSNFLAASWARVGYPPFAIGTALAAA